MADNRQPTKLPKSKRHYAVTLALLIIFLIFAAAAAASYFKNRNTQSSLVPQVQALSLPDSDPVEILIPKIKVDATFEKLGLDANKAIEVPKDPNKVGWYQYAPTPGHLGPAVVLGHLDSATGPAVFYELKDLQPGDEIDIKRTDGKTAVFTVSDAQSYPLDKFPNDKVYGPISYAGLRLITCEGAFLRALHHYNENRVVYAYLSAVK